ncbi:MAG: hypothetical protein AAGD28_23105, partial [Bacteroidota bacterium]
MKHNKYFFRMVSLLLFKVLYTPAICQEDVNFTEREILTSTCKQIKDAYVDLKGVHTISHSEHGYILTSPAEKQVLEIDRDLNPIHSFGIETANQPDQASILKYPLHAPSNDSWVFVSDLFSKSIKLY